MQLTKDMKKEVHALLDNLVDSKGRLKENTVYAFPVSDLNTVTADNKKQTEFLTLEFEKGTDLELIRRNMQEWASEQFHPYPADYVFAKMGYPELLSDGLYRKQVEVSERLRK